MVADLGEIAAGRQMRVDAAEVRVDLALGQVHGGRDDMARALAPELDDVFAEIGLDGRYAGLFERAVEVDLLGNHRLALGNGLRLQAAAEPRTMPRASSACRGPMDLAALFFTLASKASR